MLSYVEYLKSHNVKFFLQTLIIHQNITHTYYYVLTNSFHLPLYTVLCLTWVCSLMLLYRTKLLAYKYTAWMCRLLINNQISYYNISQMNHVMLFFLFFFFAVSVD